LTRRQLNLPDDFEQMIPLPIAPNPVRRNPANDPADLRENDVYAAIGEGGFRALAAAFYRRVPEDDILGPMYPPTDLAGAEERLREYLIYRFGGPLRYIETRGHPRLRMRHAPFCIGKRERDRWMKVMTGAMEEVSLPPEVARLLLDFFAATATAMLNRAD
jgi:hemoglobin